MAAAADSRQRSDIIRRAALDCGFQLVGMTPAVTPPGFANLTDWLNRGFAGEMTWIERRLDAYENPGKVLPQVRSIVMVGLNYRSDDPVVPPPGFGRVSRYAWNGVDYHAVVREKLLSVAAALHESAPDVRTRAVVDTAPLLERDYARLAGLGWFGKNTLLINKLQGSWLFLGALLTDCELQYDAVHHASHCGTCTRCLDACPTDAFPEPFVLDATRCISYLNIELRDQPVPDKLRAGVGDWVFGCDICQDVCPWNRKAPSGEDTFHSLPDRNPIDCEVLLQMTPEEFRLRFAGTPLERTGRDALARNAAIVLGNCGGEEALPALERGCEDASELVRTAAAWARDQITAKSQIEG